MSPILIRPVREQIEHDRIIRVLQARLRKQFDVEANLGDDRRVPVRVGEQLLYPDLVLTAIGPSKKVQAIIEVETTESVNHLEAMAEWAHYGKAKAPFHLYVPSGLVEMARRLVENYGVSVEQLWSYSPVGDQIHFWLVSGDGEGTIVTSVTDSILMAEPVAPPPVEEAPAPAEQPATAAVSDPQRKPARPPKAAAKAVEPPAAAARAAKTNGKPAPQPAKPTAKASAPPAKPAARRPAKPAPAAAAAAKAEKPRAQAGAAKRTKPAQSKAGAGPRRATPARPVKKAARPAARPAKVAASRTAAKAATARGRAASKATRTKKR